MKSIQEVMTQDISESRSLPYSIAFICNGMMVECELTLRDPAKAKYFDKFLEEELGNSVYHVYGGPNDIEL